MKNIIYFTKLGTVKSDDFELTYEDFFQMLYDNINRNVEEYGVYYNDKNDCYEIVFNSISCQVKYGNETVNNKCQNKDIRVTLEKLIELTHKQKKVKKEEKKYQKKLSEAKKEDEDIEQIAIKNGNKGIFNSEEDKKIYISYLINNLKYKKGFKNAADIFSNDISGWLSTVDVFKKILDFFDFYDDDAIFTSSIPACVSLIVFVVAAILTSGEIFGIPLLLVGFCDLNVFVAHDNGGKNIISFLISLLGCILYSASLPFRFVYSLAKSIITSMLHNSKIKHNIKKKIQMLEKSLKNGKDKVNTKVKSKVDAVKENMVEKKLQENAGNNSKVNQQTIKDIIREFQLLKDKVVQIQDEKKKKEYSQELLDIVNYYKEISKTFEKNGNILATHKNILDQIVSMTFRVDEVLSEEKKAKETEEEFKKMLDEIDTINNETMGGNTK